MHISEVTVFSKKYLIFEQIDSPGLASTENRGPRRLSIIVITATLINFIFATTPESRLNYGIPDPERGLIKACTYSSRWKKGTRRIWSLSGMSLEPEFYIAESLPITGSLCI